MSDRTQRVAVVTGTRAEFGLLAPVMRAIEAHPRLELLTFLTGTHLLAPAYTRREVEREFRIDAEIPMQNEGETGRFADAIALGRGRLIDADLSRSSRQSRGAARLGRR